MAAGVKLTTQGIGGAISGTVTGSKLANPLSS